MEKRSAKERAPKKGREHKPTEGKQVKDALLESEALYKHLVDACPDPVVILQDDRYQFVNPAFTRLFGYTQQDLDRGISFLETIQEQDKKAARQRYEKRLAGKQLPKTNTIDLIANDGTPVPCETSATMIQYQGQPADLVIIRDITERKRAEEELRESEEKFHILSEQNMLGIIIIQDGLVKYVNQAACEITEYSHEEALNWVPGGFSKLFHPDDLEFVMKQAQKKQKGEKDVVTHYSYRIVTKSGKVIWVDQYSKTISFEGRNADFITILDITERKRAEEVVRESEERFRIALKNSLITVFNQDRNLRFTWAYNPGLDFRLEDVLGKTDADLAPPDDVAEVMAIKRRVIETGVAARIEVSFMIGGQKTYHDLNVEPVLDRNGKITGITCVVIDITERKQTEKALRESEEKFRAIVENFPNGAVVLYDHDLRYLLAEGEVIEKVGLTSDMMVGNTLRNIVTDEYYNALAPYYKMALKGETHRFEFEFGGIIHDTSTVPIKDSDGNIIAGMSISQDITDRKRAEEALLERIKELSCLYGISKLKDDPDRDFDKFFRDTVKLIPPAWQQPDLTCGRIIFGDREFRTDNYRETSWKQSAAITIEGKKVGMIEVFYLEEKPDIDEGPFLKEERALIDTLAREIGNYVLRTQAEEEIRKLNRELEKRVRRRTRELEAVNRELESFVYSVSHDLRAPLRAMDGFSEALVEDYAEVFDEKAKTYIRRVQRASHKMGQLIDDLLSLSHVSRSELNLQKFDISALAETVMSDLRQTHPERQVQVSIEPNLVDNGDLRLLRVVLYNLLDNAWKFTGKVDEAKIEFGRTETDRGPAFFVRDNGVGFDMRYVHKLFGAFQRLHSESEFEGTGIGLATVARIIGRHSGQAWGEGQVGRGATFYFTLPETTED